MEGILENTGVDPALENRLTGLKALKDKLAAFTEDDRSFMKTHYGVEFLPTSDGVEKGIAKLDRIIELSKTFKQVKIDHAAKRQAKAKKWDGFSAKYETGTVEVPLIFVSKLPAQASVTITSTGGGLTRRYRVTARVPVPPKEAIDALRQHKDKFDHMEVWWVPNSVLVTPIPKPDPILVGAVQTGKEILYFDVYRWVDEDYEDGYWTREGY